MSEDKSTFRCIICDKSLCDFLKDFGKYAHGKHLSHQCFKLDNYRKKALLEGWFADGYKENDGSIKVTTVSKSLAMDMAQLARDVYRCPVNISRKTCNRTCIIEGREVNERPQYCVTISNSDRYGFFEDGIVWCNIKHISYEKEENQVFNLSVNEEHSYNVYGIAVHNCQPFSVAGKRKGADDNRYLWPHMLRAIREIRPTWVIGENVAGILTMVQPGEEVEVGNQTSLFGEGSRKRVLLRQEYVVETICKDLEREGYSVQPMLIPACAVGAPHRRDRIWIIANRTDTGTESMQQTGEDGVHAAGFDSNTNCQRSEEVHKEIQFQKPNGERADGSRCELFTTHAYGDGWSGRCCEGGGNENKETFGGNVLDKTKGFSWERPASDSNSNRRWWWKDKQEQFSEREGTSDNCIGCEDGLITYSDGLRNTPCQESERCELEQSYVGSKRQWELRGINSQSHTAETTIPDWKNFPTQSPVCRRNDGLPFNVDDLTIPFTKWRQESIKGYGNAIVPQVILEIFKAIEEVEKLA